MRGLKRGLWAVSVWALVGCFDGGTTIPNAGQATLGGSTTGGGATTGDTGEGPNGDDIQWPALDAGGPDAEDGGVEDGGFEEGDDTLRIVSIDPGVGATKGGDIITVFGNGFVDGETRVLLGQSLASDVFVIDGQRLTCTTPPGNPGLADVTVSIPSLEATARLESAFRYTSSVLIISVDPPTGDVQGGEPVTLWGSGFSQGDTSVLFGGRKAIAVTVVDDGTIHATTPAGQEAGPVDVYVSNAEGQAVLKGGYIYTQAPIVDFLTPAVGPTGGGTEVTISGHGFTPDATVRFGEATVEKLSFVDANTLLAVAPAAPAAGMVSVTIQTAVGYGGLPSGFLYVDSEPTEGVSVVAVHPDLGPVGGGQTVQVVVYGLTDATDTQIAFGGVLATLISVDALHHSAMVTTPAGLEGPADVTVSTGDAQDTLTDGYTYEVSLAVTATNPPAGPIEGGTAITVFGTGFTGAAQVRVGALPCVDIVVVDSASLTCVTPPGSPGGADVTVTQGPHAATLPSGFFYESGQVDVFVVDPAKGAQAGGTYVRLLGAGFEGPATVRFDGQAATHVKVVSPTLVTCKTPPGAVGTVDVVVDGPSGVAVLPESFTYFDPVALFGGTWGPDVEGDVNITVLDGGSGEPLPDVFVMFSTNPDTPYQGFTNQAGQITFSGPDVLGQQMVSASKDGFASQSVIQFDATNITLYMKPIPPPSMGPPPPSASISGTVGGLGKYVLVPPGNCYAKSPVPGGQCGACTEASDCTDPLAKSCSPVGQSGTFCTRDCLADSDCDDGYSCLNVAGNTVAQCAPSPGKKQARCYFTMGPALPQSQDPFIVKEDGTFNIPSNMGEVAVICMGGVVDWNNTDNNTNFTAYSFGVKRHVNVVPGVNEVGNVLLNHPLTRDINVRLDNPPFDPVIGPNLALMQVYWDFGSEGVFFHPNFFGLYFMYQNGSVALSVPRQPAAWTGDVYDVTFWVLAGAISYGLDPNDPNTQDPQSLTVLRNLKSIQTARGYTLEAGQWAAVDTGVDRSVFGMHGFDDQNVWAVGAGGAILHHGGLGWGLQASPTDQDLYGIWGASATDMWAVGAEATVLHFDGAVWSPEAVPGAYADFRAVWGAGADEVFVAASSYGGIWRRTAEGWTKASVSSADLRDIHGAAPDAVWAVGRYGAIRHWDGTTWEVQNAGTTEDLFSVHVVSGTEVYAVGAGGIALKYDGVAWSILPTPVTQGLRAVWAAGPQDVYAVGDGSTLLHYDGVTWADQTLPAKVSYASLQAMWGDAMTGLGYALGTSEMLMGPLLEVPQDQSPEDGGVMGGYHVSFGVKPGVPAKYNLVDVFIPSPFGDVAVWGIVTEGGVFDFELPDFANIEGTPGIGPGGYGLRILRGYNDDFDIDNYDNSDFNPKSWSMDTTSFSK